MNKYQSQSVHIYLSIYFSLSVFVNINQSLHIYFCQNLFRASLFFFATSYCLEFKSIFSCSEIFTPLFFFFLKISFICNKANSVCQPLMITFSTMINVYETNMLLLYHNEACSLLPFSFFFSAVSSNSRVSRDALDSLSPFVSIGHHTWPVLLLASSDHTELLNVSYWLSTNTGVYMCGGPHDNIDYEFVLAFPAVPSISWIVCKMGGKCLYNCCFVECYCQDLFKIACTILVKSTFSFYSKRIFKVEIVQPCNSTNMALLCVRVSVWFGFVWFYGISTMVCYLSKFFYFYLNSSISNNSVQHKYTV